MPAAVTYRPLRAADMVELIQMNIASFVDYERRLDPRPPQAGPPPEEPIERHLVRLRRLLATDPDGSWVATRQGAIVGCSIALVRDGLWGLSLLVVDPATQSAGVGRELLRLAWEYGKDARGWAILSSRDTRAVRAYARLGLDLHPSISAVGLPTGAAEGPPLRAGTAADLALTDAVDRAVRGAAHGDDVLAMIEAEHELLVLPDRGYTVIRDGAVRLLAAFDEDGARDLLRALLARFRRGGRRAVIEWITSAQGWAVEVCVEAGLELRTGAGAVFLGGDVGPFRPYLPSGAYL